MAKRYGKLLLLALTACGGSCRGASVQVAPAAAGDSSALVQESLRVRRRTEADEDQPLDLDGCPADRDFVEALRATIHGSCDGSTRSTGLVRRNDCAISVRRREEDEPMKEIYFMRHAQPKCIVDGGLDKTGIEQCKGLKANNTLLKEGALSRDPNKRAQVVYMSPTTRTMETAIRIFGDANISMVIDHRLVETFGYDAMSRCKECVTNMLKEQKRPDLLTQFEEKEKDPKQSWEAAAEIPNVRIGRFVHHLMNSPEERIVVVSHHVLLDSFQLGMTCMNMGETILKFGLTRSGWYAMSPLSCADRRRRWLYGNFRQQVGSGVDLHSQDEDDEDEVEITEED